MSLTAFAGLFLGLSLGGSIVLLVAAARGWRPTFGATSSSGHGSALWSPGARRRAAVAAAAGLVVLTVTRWPVAGVATIAVIYLWPKMFGGARDAQRHLERLEALATWTESLRDSIAGSIGLEEAIHHSINAAPPVLEGPLQRLVGRTRNYKIPLPEALAAFAEEFEDSSADLVIAALILNSRLRGPGLVLTLSALAEAAREEIDMRRRSEESRKSLRRTAVIVMATTGIFAAGLTVFSRDYVAPYSTPAGQVMLAIVIGVFAAGLIWIRSAADIKAPTRFLADADQINQALNGRSTQLGQAQLGSAQTLPDSTNTNGVAPAALQGGER